MEKIQHLKRRLLVAFTHGSLPRVAEVHGSETQRRDADAGRGRKNAVEVEEGLWLDGGTEDG